MRKKQQITEHEDSHDHIISHHAPAVLLQVEKNILKRYKQAAYSKIILGYFFNPNAGLSLLGNFLGLFGNRIKDNSGYMETELKSGRFTCELRLFKCLIFPYNVY